MISIMSIHPLPEPLDQIDQKHLITRSFDRGDTLFTQFGVTRGLFFLVEGIVDLRRVTQSGHTMLIHRARSNDTFAEASLFFDQYHCTAIAAQRALVIECNRSAILDLMDGDARFSKAMAARFAAQVQTGRRRVELLSIRAADERILAALADGMMTEDIQSFAESIGLVSETVYRTLGALAREGRVAKTSRGNYRLSIEPSR